MKFFLAFISSFQFLTNVTKNSILDVAWALGPPLDNYNVL